MNDRERGRLSEESLRQKSTEEPVMAKNILNAVQDWDAHRSGEST